MATFKVINYNVRRDPTDIISTVEADTAWAAIRLASGFKDELTGGQWSANSKLLPPDAHCDAACEAGNMHLQITDSGSIGFQAYRIA